VEELVGLSQLSPFQALIQRKISTSFNNSSLQFLDSVFFLARMAVSSFNFLSHLSLFFVLCVSLAADKI